MDYPIIFNDESWDEYNSSYDPQYRLVDDRLEFLNPILNPGTEHNQGNMNNLISFDNGDGFPGCVKTTSFSSDKMISEWRRISDNTLVARREYIYSTHTRTTLLYFPDGSIAQRRIIKTTFPNGTIKQEVNDN